VAVAAVASAHRGRTPTTRGARPHRPARARPTTSRRS